MELGRSPLTFPPARVTLVIQVTSHPEAYQNASRLQPTEDDACASTMRAISHRIGQGGRCRKNQTGKPHTQTYTAHQGWRLTPVEHPICSNIRPPDNQNQPGQHGDHLDNTDARRSLCRDSIGKQPQEQHYASRNSREDPELCQSTHADLPT